MVKKSASGKNDTIYEPIRKDIQGGLAIVTIVEHNAIREINIRKMGKSRIYFGRSQVPGDNDFFLTSGYVTNRHHGKIKLENGKILIADLNSTNGTYLFQGHSFKKMQPMKYYEVTNDFIIRIDDIDLGSQKSVLIFGGGGGKGEWKRFVLSSGVTTIGRSEDNDILLDKAGVSRKHASITKRGETYVLTDNRSVNGIYVNSIRIRKEYPLKEKDIIQIANCKLIYEAGALYVKYSASGIELQLEALNKRVKIKNGFKTILDNVSCVIKPNEFVAIIGGSGAGKTTLMNAMSGFDPDITGQIYCNGINLRQEFQTLKNIIGFVPQQDIIYENLTLRRMLQYTAKMKMPQDTSEKEIERRIQKVLGMVDLTAHADSYIRKLSGGQKKRASIAVELLADPGLFFLDEPTSGLDPGTEQKLMLTLSRLSKSQGKTIIMVTHTTQNLHLCDKIIIMGTGGKLCFCGTPDEAKMFFDTKDLVDIYHEINKRPEVWNEQYYRCNPPEKQKTGDSRNWSQPSKGQPVSFFRQLLVLIQRYAELIWNDKKRLFMLLLQPVLIAWLVSIVANKNIFIRYEDTKSVLFVLACAGIWIGMFNTIQEICKERVILKREYMANLKLGTYILSKYMVQGIMCFLQAVILCTTFLLLAEHRINKGKGVLIKNMAEMDVLITLFITILASASIGLVISAIVKNADLAMTIAPFLLIIQLLFSGILFKLTGVAKRISWLTISRWSVESLGNIARLNKLPDKLVELGLGRQKAEGIFKHSLHHLEKTWGIMLIMTVLCGIASVWMLRGLKKDQR